MIRITHSWRIVDKWWTPDPVEREFIVALWDGREITFIRRLPDQVWRIYAQA